MNINLIKWKSEHRIFILMFSFLLIAGISLFFRISYIYELRESSEFGDAVSGIVGTFINLGAALLIYITFRAQVKANNEISKQVNDERVTKLFDLFKKDEFYAEINEIYDALIFESKKAFESSNLNHSIFDNHENLQKKIADHKRHYEDIKLIYNAANDAAEFKEEPFQKLFLERMKVSIKPYLYFIHEAKEEIIDSIPIIIIETLNIKLPKTIFSIRLADSKNITLSKLEVLKVQKSIKIINLPYKKLNFPSDFIEINFGKMKPDYYDLKWHLELEGKLFYYYSYKNQF